jgi:hypothetical protein
MLQKSFRFIFGASFKISINQQRKHKSLSVGHTENSKNVGASEIYIKLVLHETLNKLNNRMYFNWKLVILSEYVPALLCSIYDLHNSLTPNCNNT